MTMPALITIETRAIPNRRTEGYRYIKHETEPDAEILAVTWKLIWDFCALVGEASSLITQVHISFERDQFPGDLRLVMKFDFSIEGSTISVEKSYGHISAPHMREEQALKDYVLEPLRNELAKKIAQQSNLLQEQSSQTEKLLDYTGQPQYDDLF